MTHKTLHAQSQKQKQQKIGQNISKQNNKDTRTTSLALLWRHNDQFQPNPTPHPNGPISSPKKANVHLAINITSKNTPKEKTTELCQEPNKHRYNINKKYSNIQIFNTFKSLFLFFENNFFYFQIHPKQTTGF